MNREELMKAIRQATVNGRLTCDAAHALSRELSVSLREIGALCNEAGIKITACQLGCF